MEPEDEHRRESCTRMTVVNDKARIEFALNQVESYVARMGPSPTTRRLRLALEVLKQTVATWETSDPTDEQVELLLEHIAEVRDLAQNSTPTVRLRRAK
jgi:hypothetical protein